MRYIVHAANVCSKNDGDWHYVSCNKLARLYKVKPRDCYFIETPDDVTGFIPEEGDIHLFPKSNGNYKLPAE